MKTKPSVGGLPNDLGNREAMRHRKPQKPQKGQPISGESQVLHVGYWYVLHDLAGGFKPMENSCCLASSCQIKGEIHQSCLTHAETILRLAMSGYFSYPAVPYPSISYHTSGLPRQGTLGGIACLQAFQGSSKRAVQTFAASHAFRLHRRPDVDRVLRATAVLVERLVGRASPSRPRKGDSFRMFQAWCFEST